MQRKQREYSNSKQIDALDEIASVAFGARIVSVFPTIREAAESSHQRKQFPLEITDERYLVAGLVGKQRSSATDCRQRADKHPVGLSALGADGFSGSWCGAFLAHGSALVRRWLRNCPGQPRQTEEQCMKPEHFFAVRS